MTAAALNIFQPIKYSNSEASTTSDNSTNAKSNSPSLKEQAETIKDNQNNGKNTVTIGTPTKQIRYDLAGDAHGGVPTPDIQ